MSVALTYATRVTPPSAESDAKHKELRALVPQHLDASDGRLSDESFQAGREHDASWTTITSICLAWTRVSNRAFRDELLRISTENNCTLDWAPDTLVQSGFEVLATLRKR